MPKIPLSDLKKCFYRILTKTGFSEKDADLTANIFANTTLDGYHSHGVNRFGAFIKSIKDGYVKLNTVPKRLMSLGSFERWDVQLGPGPLNAHFCMNRAIELAQKVGMGCVALQNGSHWMRGGTYGWQAAEAGCIGICFTNTKPNMPSWGAKTSNTGNNPLIIAVPSASGHIVLDMSLSQFSYGKLEKLAMAGAQLPFPGGYDSSGNLTTDPKAILESENPLPTGYWKGSGLSILLDMVATLLAAGRSTAKIGESDVEYGLSQVFICLDTKQMNSNEQHQQLVDEIIEHLTAAVPTKAGGKVEYPGSQTLKRRAKYSKEGIPINEEVWRELQLLLDVSTRTKIP